MDAAREIFTAPFGIEILTRGKRVVARPGWYQVLSPGDMGPSANEVIHSELTSENVEATIERVIAEYAAIGTPFKWCVSPYTRPLDMAALLEKRGFGSWPARGMYVDTAEARITVPTDVECELLTEANRDLYFETSFRGWNLQRTPTVEEQKNFREDLDWLFANRKGVAHFFLARVGGEAAGTAGFYLKEKSVYLVGGNVLPKFRGRGIYRALLDTRLRFARERGYRLAVTQARERTSAPILEKLGFQTAFRDQMFQLGGTLPE